MFKIYILLFWEFLKIGTFAIGGGYSVIPFLFYLQSQYNWFSINELTNMIAISNITPGPIGINMATYTGYKTSGITGSIIATFSIVLVPFILTLIITKLFNKFHNNKNINNIFIGLRVAACALLTFIAIKLLTQIISIPKSDLIENKQNIDIIALLIFILTLTIFSFFKKNTFITIAFGALMGISFLN